MAAQTDLIQENAPQAQTLMGYNTMQTADDGLTTGMSSGLMADPTDPMTQAQMGLGLMGLPGYQAAGQQMLLQSMGHSLGQRQRMMENQRAQQAHQMKILEFQASMAKMDREISDKQLSQASGWYKDYRADTKGLRTGLIQADSALNMIKAKGISDASNADMVGLITAIAKLRDPDSAVLTGEIDVLAAAKGLEGIGPALMNMIQLGSEIPFTVRKQLVETLLHEQRSRHRELNDLRRIWAERHSEYGIRGARLAPALSGPDIGAINRRLGEPNTMGVIPGDGGTDGPIEPAESVKSETVPW